MKTSRYLEQDSAPPGTPGACGILRMGVSLSAIPFLGAANCKATLPAKYSGRNGACVRKPM